MGCFDSSGEKSVSAAKSPAQGQWLNKALEIYGPYLGQGANIFQGERLAPFTGTQTAAMGGLGDYLDIFSAQRDMPLFGQTGTALSGILSGATGAEPLNAQQTSDYFKRVYEDPARKEWKENIRPLAREEFAGPGFWGSARAKAVTETGQDVSDWLGTQRGQLEWDAFRQNQALAEAKAARTQTGISQAMSYGQLPTQEAQQRLAGRAGVFDFAGAGQQQQQAELDVAMQKWSEGKQLTDPEILNVMMSLLNLGFASSSSSAWGSGLGYSALGSAGGAAGTALGKEAGGAIWTALAASDIRIKENIKPITDALSKIRSLKPYLYNYINDKKTTVGIMAQDVEKVMPEAVVDIDGVKHINLFSIQALIIGAIGELLGGKNG